jgi:hypothetical protein
MAAREGLLKFGIAAVNLVIVALMFTSIWPFPHGDFKVDLPSANEISWSYSGGVVHVIAPYSIDNGGYYDVKDLVLSYSVVNITGYPLADQRIPIGDVPAGQVTSSDLDFNFDLLRLFNDGALGMVFSDDLLRFRIDVSCLYTMKLVKFDATYQVSVPWEALIKGYGIDWQASNLPDPPTFSHLPPYNIVYWLDTSDLLVGLPAAQVTLTVVGTTSNAPATGTTTIQLGGNNTGSVTFDPTLLAFYTSITALRVDVQVADFSWAVQYPIPEGV